MTAATFARAPRADDAESRSPIERRRRRPTPTNARAPREFLTRAGAGCTRYSDRSRGRGPAAAATVSGCPAPRRPRAPMPRGRCGLRVLPPSLIASSMRNAARKSDSIEMRTSAPCSSSRRNDGCAACVEVEAGRSCRPASPGSAPLRARSMPRLLVVGATHFDQDVLELAAVEGLERKAPLAEVEVAACRTGNVVCISSAMFRWSLPAGARRGVGRRHVDQEQREDGRDEGRPREDGCHTIRARD